MATIRELRRRIKSTKSIKKITRAMELIATSKIMKARARVEASRPYADEITKVLTELANNSALDHPLLVEREAPKRAGVLVVTSDRGQCGGYNVNVLKEAERLMELLREQGKEPVIYVIGRKGQQFYRFRKRPIAEAWTGFSEEPRYLDAATVAETLVADFMAGSGGEADDLDTGAVTPGVDELHLVFTSFKNMVTQVPEARRLAPLEVEYVGETPTPGQDQATVHALYTFEPDADTLFDALLPKYVTARLFAALLESAASESANRQRAMKAATDNANELIRTLTLDANQARQAQITQEISEIVGGADALVSAGSDY